MRISYRGPRVT